MREVYIVDAVRTPVGRMGGTLKNTQAHEMGGLVCKALMERTGLAPELVEEVVIAQVKQNAVASNIARVCALMAGFREEIPAYTLMMQCGSSLQSVNCAANDIRCGDVDVAVAGGVEAMSATHFELWNARYGYGTGNNVLVDPIVEGPSGPSPRRPTACSEWVIPPRTWPSSSISRGRIWTSLPSTASARPPRRWPPACSRMRLSPW